MAGTAHGSAKKTVMVVDDESAVRQVLHDVLQDSYDVILVPSGEECLAQVQVQEPNMILLDLMMPGMQGLDVLEALHRGDSQVPVVVLTATTSYQTAVQAMKLGAVDYLAKPFEVAELRHVIERAITTRNLYNEVQYHRRRAGTAQGQDQMVGKSAAMQEVFTRIRQVADTPSTVLITGESGTGKELVARALHLNSGRADKPFIALNCAAIPETLIEAELFGHEKGAFTSATGKRIGHFELADTGSLFLDELGELSMPTQAKLLRVLQEREFTRVGGGRPIHVNVRLIAATNQNLEAAIKAGRFREDLYYRLAVFPINLPPLRERPDDVVPLVEHFLERHTPPGKTPLRLGREAAELMARHPWPGNIRELENVLEQVLILNQGGTIRPEDLPAHIGRRATAAPAAPAETVIVGDVSFDRAVADYERRLIVRALNETGFVQTRAATMLGITRRVLKYKMDQLDIPARPTYSE
ncbi:MAG: sigma-54-dependent Fis family transcriptional regulator [Nitrospirae bacterium]|nr:sigma-54-dependent Fis family transcriptional regulator [Nitrospirota bacterium]